MTDNDDTFPGDDRPDDETPRDDAIADALGESPDDDDEDDIGEPKLPLPSTSGYRSDHGCAIRTSAS